MVTYRLLRVESSGTPRVAPRWRRYRDMFRCGHVTREWYSVGHPARSYLERNRKLKTCPDCKAKCKTHVTSFPAGWVSCRPAASSAPAAESRWRNTWDAHFHPPAPLWCPTDPCPRWRVGLNKERWVTWHKAFECKLTEQLLDSSWIYFPRIDSRNSCNVKIQKITMKKSDRRTDDKKFVVCLNCNPSKSLTFIQKLFFQFRNDCNRMIMTCH